MSLGREAIGFWLTWLLTFLGFPIGGVLAFALVKSVDGVVDGAVAGAAAGAAIGLAQWLVLRRIIPVDLWWVGASSLGLAVGLALGVALAGTDTSGGALVLRGAIAGAAVGLAQWLVLRQYVPMAGWWALAVVAGWALGWVLTRAAGVDLSFGWAVFGSLGALVFAALTGGVLVWMRP